MGQPGTRPSLPQQGQGAPGIVGEFVNFFIPLVLSLFPSWNVEQYYNTSSPSSNPPPNNNNNNQQQQPQQPQLHPVEDNHMDVAQPL